jgi:hypothetical protein
VDHSAKKAMVQSLCDACTGAVKAGFTINL